MKKVVYIGHLPLTDSLMKNFFIDELMQENIDVEYWDISKICFHDINMPDELIFSFIRKMQRKDEVRKEIARNNNESTIFIVLFGYSWKFLWMHRIFLRRRLNTLFFWRGLLPMPQQTGKLKKILRKVRELEFEKLWGIALDKIAMFLKHIGVVNSHDVVFAAGSVAIKQAIDVRHVIEANYHDYDDWLLTKDSNSRIVKGDYAVFVDEYMPFHPDWKIFGEKVIDPEEYYRGVNAFFDLVERKWGVKVVIAAHPKSDYRKNVYQDREIYKYKTNELIKDCKFVLGHASSSFSFAVLYKKPIFFLCSNQIKKSGPVWFQPFVVNFARVLGGRIYNVDDVQYPEQINMPVVDASKYECYKYNYLTSHQSEDRITRDVFLDFIKGS